MKVSRRAVLNAGCCCSALSLLEVFPGCIGTAAATIELTVSDRFRWLPPGAVRLDGYLDRYIRLSIDNWAKSLVPYKALAAFFRDGRPKFEWNGREVELFASGEMWGKAVRSAALFYRYTGDPQLKETLKATVADLLNSRRSNGTLSCTPAEKQPDGPGGDLWERKYVLLGLDAYYEYIDPDPEVLKAMTDEVDATIAQVGLPPKARIVDLGWSAGLVGGDNIESSTILEPVLRLYKRTGDVRYREFARYIVETEGGGKGHNLIDEVLRGLNPVEVGGIYPKAYETLSLFEGLSEYYRVTGNERWRQACLQLYQKVMEREITVIGNGGGDEPYHPNVRGEAWDNTALEQTNPNVKRMMETCTGVTWLKYCSQILRLTGDPIAVDYIELYAYNGLIGAMKPRGDGFSYVNLLNGIKTEPTGWGARINGVYVTCCNLNGPVGLAYLPLVAVMGDVEGAVVNLYNAGTIELAEDPTGRTTLAIQTRYPLEGAVRIKVTPSSPRHFVIKLRIPAWSRETGVKVNGQSVPSQPGSYLRLERKWAAGDVIALDLDMRCRVVPAKLGLSEASDHYQALVRGPIVLARDENIDPHFDQAVDIVAHEGIVDVKATPPIRSDANMQFAVPTRSGMIQMVDYASVNSWQGKRVQTWLPMTSRSSSGRV